MNVIKANRYVLSLVAALVLIPGSGYAWNNTGHELVAGIAGQSDRDFAARTAERVFAGPFSK
jgi:hypothetical protein